jgi:hypothetical protein
VPVCCAVLYKVSPEKPHAAFVLFLKTRENLIVPCFISQFREASGGLLLNSGVSVQGVQEEVQLREQDFGNFQNTEGEEERSYDCLLLGRFYQARTARAARTCTTGARPLALSLCSPNLRMLQRCVHG